MKYRKLTPAQRLILDTLLRTATGLKVTPENGRTLASLARRGTVRYRSDPTGGRIAYRPPSKATRRRWRRADRLYQAMQATGWIPECIDPNELPSTPPPDQATLDLGDG